MIRQRFYLAFEKIDTAMVNSSLIVVSLLYVVSHLTLYYVNPISEEDLCGPQPRVCLTVVSSIQHFKVQYASVLTELF